MMMINASMATHLYTVQMSWLVLIANDVCYQISQSNNLTVWYHELLQIVQIYVDKTLSIYQIKIF